MKYSNCLVVALYLRYKLKGSTIHYIRTNRSPFPHFYVKYKTRIISFRSIHKDEPWWQHLYFLGKLDVRRKPY